MAQRRFDAIPGSPWTYWIRDSLRRLFETLPKLGDVPHTSDLLTRLAQAGLLQVSRSLYRLTPTLYREAQVEQPAISSEEMILAYVRAHGRIARREAVALCGLTEKRAEYRLRQLVQAGRLRLVGRGHGAHYVLGERGETPKNAHQNSGFGV